MSRDRKLTTAELADLLSVSPDTVRDWAASGAIPALRACRRGRWLFDADEVLAALRRAGRAPGAAVAPAGVAS
jgi:excisionase family DNA binding protein